MIIKFYTMLNPIIGLPYFLVGKELALNSDKEAPNKYVNGSKMFLFYLPQEDAKLNIVEESSCLSLYGRDMTSVYEVIEEYIKNKRMVNVSPYVAAYLVRQHIRDKVKRAPYDTFLKNHFPYLNA